MGRGWNAMWVGRRRRSQMQRNNQKLPSSRGQRGLSNTTKLPEKYMGNCKNTAPSTQAAKGHEYQENDETHAPPKDGANLDIKREVCVFATPRRIVEGTGS